MRGGRKKHSPARGRKGTSAPRLACLAWSDLILIPGLPAAQAGTDWTGGLDGLGGLQCRTLQLPRSFSPLTCKPAARAFFHITLALT